METKNHFSPLPICPVNQNPFHVRQEKKKKKGIMMHHPVHSPHNRAIPWYSTIISIYSTHAYAPQLDEIFYCSPIWPLRLRLVPVLTEDEKSILSARPKKILPESFSFAATADSTSAKSAWAKPRG